MQGNGVHDIVVDALENVDFAVVGPVGADGPEGGPDRTHSSWHVFDVCDEEAVGVGVFRVYANGLAAGGGVVKGVIGGKVDCSPRGVLGMGAILLVTGREGNAFIDETCKASYTGILSGEVFDEAVGGIFVGEEIEGLEEVGVVVVVSENVRCLSGC